MQLSYQMVVSLVLLLAPQEWAMSGFLPPPTDYQKAWAGLEKGTIHAGMSADKMFDNCIPSTRSFHGEFTAYNFELLPGYHGLAFVAKNGRLCRAIEWSCTYRRTFFDEMTPDDLTLYYELFRQNAEPEERCIGRWGWHRPPRRLWDPAFGAPPAEIK